MPASTTPTQLAADQAAQTLTIRWADGRRSVYSYEGLRGACPCAECKGGHDKMQDPVDPMIFELPTLVTRTIKELRPAGNYALRVVWGDGHEAGLYRWDYLRGLKPTEPMPNEGEGDAS